mmetsp:Transcript_38721/g.90689  ORF Transcript_38721/g.90689 Transcript_38721/m.90689 type:complete len:226 (+) Transcript_38721:1756-2433(+)
MGAPCLYNRAGKHIRRPAGRGLLRRPGPALRPRSLGRQGVQAGLGDDAVLVRGAAGHADGADDLAVHDDGQAALDRVRAAQRQHPRAGGAAGDDVLEGLGGALEQRRGDRLVLRHQCAAGLGVVELVVDHQRAGGVDHRDRHREALLAGLGNRGADELVGLFVRHIGPIGQVLRDGRCRSGDQAQGQGGGRNGATEHGDLQKKGKGDMPPLGGAVTLRPRAAPRH